MKKRSVVLRFFSLKPYQKRKRDMESRIRSDFEKRRDKNRRNISKRNYLHIDLFACV